LVKQLLDSRTGRFGDMEVNEAMTPINGHSEHRYYSAASDGGDW
jgi:hypothetical protein